VLWRSDRSTGRDDTAVDFVARSSWSNAAEAETRISIADDLAPQFEPFASGVYVNDLTDEGEAGVRRAYGSDKLARLAALKNRYDPENVFHLNHNIPPDRQKAQSTKPTIGTGGES
jgi:berberine-like enzyme